MTTRLHIRLLGDFRLDYDATPVTTVNTPRLQSLLAYLLLHRHAPQLRSHLAFLLWPDSTEAQARTNLRHQVHLLRQALPEADRFLQIDAHTLQWRPEAPCRLDVADFESATAPTSALMALQEAVDLYHGDLLPSCYDEWLLLERERLRQRFMAALERLIGLLEHERDYTTAIRYAHRLLQADPLHEATYRHLMRLYALNGDGAGVRRTYQECVTVLQRDLAAEPGPATRAAYQHLLNSDISYVPPHNLPTHLTPFINREVELAELARRLNQPTCRLLTLVGPGGIGKSRLAIRAARQVMTHAVPGGVFRHGVYLTPLASISEAKFLASAVADALNFAFHGPEDPQVQLLNYLREKEMLLILDNFEHLLTPPLSPPEGGMKGRATPEEGKTWGTELLVDILTHAPGVKLLVTSRERLNLSGEWLFEVEGLSIPPARFDVAGLRGNVSEEGLEKYSAVALFLQTAQRVHAGFALSAETQPSLVRLCRVVEGMPLALELAATWVRTLTCAEIVQQVEQNLGFLTSSLRDIPPRHHSIQAVFDHSWNRLSAEERRVFRQLAVFQGGFRREAAERVAGASLPFLLALVDKSLLHWWPEGRYQMHELLRQYAAEKLAEVPADQATAQDRHGRYYLEFLRRQEAWLKSHQQKQAMEEIRLEIDNVRLACRQAIAQGWARELGQAAQTLLLFYDAQGWFHEAEAIFRQAVEELARERGSGGAEEQEDRGEGPIEGFAQERERGIGLGQVLAQQGWFSFRLGLLGKAKALFQQGVTLLRRLGARVELAEILQFFSMVAWAGGDYREAQAILQEGLLIFSEQEAPWSIALCLCCLGNVATLVGNYGEAKQLLQQALALFKETGDPRLTAMALNYLSPVAYTLGEYTEAKQWLQESLSLSREIDDRWDMIVCLNHLGAVTYLGGPADWPQARRLHEESLAIAKELGDRREMAVSLNYLGYVTCALEQYPAARQHFLAALQMAIEGQMTPVALDALVGLAPLLSQQPAGETGLGLAKMTERAIELLALVLSHPATGHEVKDKAQRLLAELEAELPPQVLAVAQARGQARTLEEVVREILAL